MTYAYYKKVFEGQSMPFAFVDQDLLLENAAQIKKRAGDKNIRIATKSVRCRGILQMLLDLKAPFKGLMCYTAEEAIWLANQGFDDLLVAYPTVDLNHIRGVAETIKKGKTIYLMTDSETHLNRIQQIGKEENIEIPICLDLDMSSRFTGIFFGVKRSKVFEQAHVESYIKQVKKCPNIRLAGLMGYEAQIAGLGDDVPKKAIMNRIIRRLKKRSLREITQRREEAVAYIKAEGFLLDFVNGGGTGSMETTREEKGVTEITVGSGFYSSHLFDNYQAFRHLPAAAYAIQIVRQPEDKIYTCLGGGYVASGAVGIEKIPIPYLPESCKLLKNEMAGEVQTPIFYDGKPDLAIGDPIFLRHSKSGELCEHFNQLMLVSKGKLIKKIPTYRGENQSFL